MVLLFFFRHSNYYFLFRLLSWRDLSVLLFEVQLSSQDQLFNYYAYQQFAYLTHLTWLKSKSKADVLVSFSLLIMREINQLLQMQTNQTKGHLEAYISLTINQMRFSHSLFQVHINLGPSFVHQLAVFFKNVLFQLLRGPAGIVAFHGVWNSLVVVLQQLNPIKSI